MFKFSPKIDIFKKGVILKKNFWKNFYEIWILVNIVLIFDMVIDHKTKGYLDPIKNKRYE
jgi:hypothetical protein